MISRKELYRKQPASRLIVPARPTQFGPSKWSVLNSYRPCEGIACFITETASSVGD